MTEGESESGKKTRTGSRNRENYTRNISWYTYILCLSRVRFSPFRPMVPYAIFRASGVSVYMRCVCGIRVSYLWFSLISRMNFPKNSISNSSMAHFLLLSYSLCLPICFLFHMNTFVLIWFLFLLVCQRTMHSSFALCVLNKGRGGIRMRIHETRWKKMPCYNENANPSFSATNNNKITPNNLN